MTRFSADWLRLREPFDHRARDTAAVKRALPKLVARWREVAAGQALAVVDLACGNGANMRELAPQMGGPQIWRLVDRDPALLAAVPDALAEWAGSHRYRFALGEGEGAVRSIHVTGPDFSATVTRHRIDLARDLAALDFAQTPLVTASALLDLVSASWLQALIRKARGARAAMLFALNVDGRTTWNPTDPGDESVHSLFSQHQRRDKGFGLALGPQAAAIALQHMASAGYQTLQTRSDWIIDGAQAAEMQRAMVEGMAAAALEQEPAARGAVQLWKARRLAGVGATRLRVGHVDIVATLR